MSLWNLFGYSMRGQFRHCSLGFLLKSPFHSLHCESSQDILFGVCENGDLFACNVSEFGFSLLDYQPSITERACALLHYAPSVWMSAAWKVESLASVCKAGVASVIITTCGGHRVVYTWRDRFVLQAVKLGMESAELVRNWCMPECFVQVTRDDRVRIVYDMGRGESDVVLSSCGMSVLDVCEVTDVSFVVLSVGQATLIHRTSPEERGAALAALSLEAYAQYVKELSGVLGDELLKEEKSVEFLKEEKGDAFLKEEKGNDLLNGKNTNDLLNGKKTNEHLLKGETHSLFNVLSYYCKSNDPAALRLLSRSLTPSLTAVLLQCVRAYCRSPIIIHRYITAQIAPLVHLPLLPQRRLPLPHDHLTRIVRALATLSAFLASSFHLAFPIAYSIPSPLTP